MLNDVWKWQNQLLKVHIRDLRKSAGLTQSELAKALDKPQSYVSKYESGERRLDIIELREIVHCCGSCLEKFVKKFEKDIASEES